jgi:ABC-type phosphate transport system substrate-binding protein
MMCGMVSAPAYAGSAGTISGAGSTTAENAVRQWSADIESTGQRVDYDGTGTANGQVQYTSDLVDFAVTDYPFPSPPARKYAEVPLTGTPIAVAYRLPGITGVRLSEPVLAGIFTGTITRWDDPAVAADNPGVTLPAIPIVPVVRSDTNGATRLFTSWLAARQHARWNDYCDCSPGLPLRHHPTHRLTGNFPPPRAGPPAEELPRSHRPTAPVPEPASSR